MCVAIATCVVLPMRWNESVAVQKKPQMQWTGEGHGGKKGAPPSNDEEAAESKGAEGEELDVVSRSHCFLPPLSERK